MHHFKDIENIMLQMWKLLFCENFLQYMSINVRIDSKIFKGNIKYNIYSHVSYFIIISPACEKLNFKYKLNLFVYLVRQIFC